MPAIAAGRTQTYFVEQLVERVVWIRKIRKIRELSKMELRPLRAAWFYKNVNISKALSFTRLIFFLHFKTRMTPSYMHTG